MVKPAATNQSSTLQQYDDGAFVTIVPGPGNDLIIELERENLVRNSSGQTKRKKITEEICTIENFNPGLSAEKSRNLVDMTRSIGTRFHILVALEKEKRRISIAAYESLLRMKDEFMSLIDNLIVDNSVIFGRMLESRLAEEVAIIDRKIALEREAAAPRTSVPPSTSLPHAMEVEQPQSIAMELDKATGNKSGSTKRRRRKKWVQVYAPTQPTTSRGAYNLRTGDNTDTDGPTTEPKFTEVVSRRRNRRLKASSRANTSASEAENRSKSAKSAMDKDIERLKNVQIQKAFFIEIANETTTTVKNTYILC